MPNLSETAEQPIRTRNIWPPSDLPHMKSWELITNYLAPNNIVFHWYVRTKFVLRDKCDLLCQQYVFCSLHWSHGIIGVFKRCSKQATRIEMAWTNSISKKTDPKASAMVIISFFLHVPSYLPPSGVVILLWSPQSWLPSHNPRSRWHLNPTIHDSCRFWTWHNVNGQKMYVIVSVT